MTGTPAAEAGARYAQQATSKPACCKCGGMMKPGLAMGQTFSCSREGTCSPAGPGKIVPCAKCSECGWSVSVGEPPAGAEVEQQAEPQAARDAVLVELQ